MEHGDIKTLYSVKRLFTKGIVEQQHCEVRNIQGTLYASRQAGHMMHPDYLFEIINGEIFETREQAVARAKEMVRRKLKSIDKQSRKLSELLKELEK